MKPINYIAHLLSALALAGAATLYLEHSQLDLALANLVYLQDGRWLIDKSDPLFDAMLYTMPKRLLIIFELYMIVAFFWRYKNRHNQRPLPMIFTPLAHLSVRELGYSALAMLVVPTVVASLKSITHTPCPVSLELFGGQLPYLPLIENMQMGFRDKCFPAAHASSGFALYALCFVPNLRACRVQWAVFVSVYAWLLGGYKMAIGDHFFSHTVVSMLLAWAICAGLAWLMFGKKTSA